MVVRPLVIIIFLGGLPYEYISDISLLASMRVFIEGWFLVFFHFRHCFVTPLHVLGFNRVILLPGVLVLNDSGLVIRDLPAPSPPNLQATPPHGHLLLDVVESCNDSLLPEHLVNHRG